MKNTLQIIHLRKDTPQKSKKTHRNSGTTFVVIAKAQFKLLLKPRPTQKSVGAPVVLWLKIFILYFFEVIGIAYCTLVLMFLY